MRGIGLTEQEINGSLYRCILEMAGLLHTRVRERIKTQYNKTHNKKAQIQPDPNGRIYPVRRQ